MTRPDQCFWFSRTLNMLARTTDVNNHKRRKSKSETHNKTRYTTIRDNTGARPSSKLMNFRNVISTGHSTVAVFLVISDLCPLTGLGSSLRIDFTGNVLFLWAFTVRKICANCMWHVLGKQVFLFAYV